MRRSPAAAGAVTVTFADTATAPAGMPQVPVTTKLRSAPAAREGPPRGPAGLRVSSTRQGVRVWKLVAAGGGVAGSGSTASVAERAGNVSVSAPPESGAVPAAARRADPLKRKSE